MSNESVEAYLFVLSCEDTEGESAGPLPGREEPGSSERQHRPLSIGHLGHVTTGNLRAKSVVQAFQTLIHRELFFFFKMLILE